MLLLAALVGERHRSSADQQLTRADTEGRLLLLEANNQMLSQQLLESRTQTSSQMTSMGVKLGQLDGAAKYARSLRVEPTPEPDAAREDTASQKARAASGAGTTCDGKPFSGSDFEKQLDALGVNLKVQG